MNDEDVDRMLERLAERVPVGPAPVDDLVRVGKSVQRRKRRAAVFGASAALAVVLSGGVVAQNLTGDGAPSMNDPTKGPFVTLPSPTIPKADLDNPTGGMSGSLPDGGAASCVESYTPEAVAGRAFAFDGVVVNIGPARSNRSGKGHLNLVGVTFAVGEWFAGGTAPTVTVDMGVPMAGTRDVTGEVFHSYAVGSRLLVSGEPRWGGSPLDAAIAWGCGFIRYYDRETAESWRQATAEEEPSEPTPRPTRSSSSMR
ncbi:hypothetical protein AAH979_35230 [Plantactinospora sp. ZYX-F-223]|uniref:hypothetical protein n=1 Tax=Plantactinospora sp. ZYX-F-223 TaxID=3144103 RepID=UPI0031FE40E9